jgi:hypothetical protein
MASVLARRLNLLEGRLGMGETVTISRICPRCGAAVAFDDPGPCDGHPPPREAATAILVAFIAPSPCPSPA